MSNCRLRLFSLTAGLRQSLPGIIVMLVMLVSAGKLVAQTVDQVAIERKIVARIEPEYPEALKRLYIGGVVKVEAVVTANGAVESTQLLGGSPILGQSAMKAIRQWKFSPSSNKEKLVVQVAFDPHR
jgi:TonB family protein